MRAFLPDGNSAIRSSPLRLRALWPSVMLLLCAALASSAAAQTPSEKIRQTPAQHESAIDSRRPARIKEENRGVSVKAAVVPQSVDAVDIPALVRDSDFNGATIHEGLLDFTYTMKRTRLKLDRDGKVKDEDVNVFEAYPIIGRHVLIRISENGSPVSEEKVLEARRRSGELLEMVEPETNDKRVEIAKAEAGSAIKRHLIVEIVGSAGKTISVFWDPADFFRTCEFSSPRTELLDNREAIVLEFRPRPGFYLPKAKSFIPRLVGRVWIDRLDRVVMRLEGWLPPEEAGAKGRVRRAPHAESVIIYEQMRLPTGEWFPHYVRMNSGGDPTLFNGLNWDVRLEFSDYKRFNADVQDVKIIAPKKNP